MSNFHLQVVPRDPFFVPYPAVEDEARRFYATAMPGAWTVESVVNEPMGLVDSGESMGSFTCPACGAELDLGWVIELLPDPPAEPVAPCCERPVRLADIRGEGGDCFARFHLRAYNPDDVEAPAEVLAGVERILQVPVTSVAEWL